MGANGLENWKYVKKSISYFDFISSLQAQKNVKYYKIFNYKTFQLHLQNITTVA